MGGVDVGEGGGKRSTNAEINMIPFIDLLMVTVAFLLITAVWVTNSRINANAQVPGPPDPTTEVVPQTPEKVLHLTIGADEFKLAWKQGNTVVAESSVPKPEAAAGDGLIRYPDLASKIETEWGQHGNHKEASDKKIDQAILYSDNRAPFKEIVAVLDALYQAKREMVLPSGKTQKVPVFNMTFSIR
jgi:biopolymer transport protein ExbD